MQQSFASFAGMLAVVEVLAYGLTTEGDMQVRRKLASSHLVLTHRYPLMHLLFWHACLLEALG